MKTMGSMFGVVGASLLSGVVNAQDIQATFSVPGSWEGGYTGKIEIENTGSSSIEGWDFQFRGGPDIGSLWNGVWSEENGLHRITNVDWNSVVLPGQRIELGFNGVGVLLRTVSDCTLNGLPVTVLYGSEVPGDDDSGDGSGEDEIYQKMCDYADGGVEALNKIYNENASFNLPSLIRDAEKIWKGS